jgi:Tfp pilus assembly pilus retraction ATPase PilT
MQGKRAGMQLMNEALAELVRSGAVAADAAMRRSSSPDDLARQIGLPVQA